MVVLSSQNSQFISRYLNNFIDFMVSKEKREGVYQKQIERIVGEFIVTYLKRYTRIFMESGKKYEIS
jgi:hypothetical protein